MNNVTLSNIKQQASIFYELAMTVLDWLNYINRISKGQDILDESSFKYPITEYLERKKDAFCGLELNHPIFKRKKVDVVWRYANNSSSIKSEQEWEYFMELKYASNTDVQRIFDDLCRLYYIKKKYNSSRCYFLICGEKELFVTNFQNKIIQSQKSIEQEVEEKEYKGNNQPPYSKWFTLQPSNPTKIIECESNNKYYRSFLTRKKGKYIFYNPQDKIDKIRFQTRLLERRTNANSHKEFCIAIWEIELVDCE